MEQDDLKEFHYLESDTDLGTPGVLVCMICAEDGKVVKKYPVGSIVPNLLEFMEDAAEHFAAVHRKTDEAV